MDLNLNFKDIKIEEINLTFDKYLRELDITDDLKLKCNEAEILLLPPNLEGNTYPEITGDLFQYLKNNLPAEVKIELPVEDENYGETRFYGEPIFIKYNFIPEFVDLTNKSQDQLTEIILRQENMRTIVRGWVDKLT